MLKRQRGGLTPKTQYLKPKHESRSGIRNFKKGAQCVFDWRAWGGEDFFVK